eukprot:s1479_g3.t1
MGNGPAEDGPPDDAGDVAAAESAREGPQVSAKASELSSWVLAALRSGERPELLADFVSRAIPLEDWENHQFEHQLRLAGDAFDSDPLSKTGKASALWKAAEAGANLPFGPPPRRPPPLPQKHEEAEPLQQLRTNLAELDVIMARLTHRAASSEGDAPQAPQPQLRAEPVVQRREVSVPVVQRHRSAGSLLVKAPGPGHTSLALPCAVAAGVLGSELRRLVTVVFLDAQREEESPALRWLYSVCDNFEQFYARLQLLLTPTERTVELPP